MQAISVSSVALKPRDRVRLRVLPAYLFEVVDVLEGGKVKLRLLVKGVVVRPEEVITGQASDFVLIEPDN